MEQWIPKLAALAVVRVTLVIPNDAVGEGAFWSPLLGQDIH